MNMNYLDWFRKAEKVIILPNDNFHSILSNNAFSIGSPISPSSSIITNEWQVATETRVSIEESFKSTSFVLKYKENNYIFFYDAFSSTPSTFISLSVNVPVLSKQATSIFPAWTIKNGSVQNTLPIKKNYKQGF